MPAEISLETVLHACHGQAAHVGAGVPAAFSSVSIDSRTLAPGALYVAIVGERHDGHAFAAQAVAQGARGVVVARGRGAALAQLAAHVVEVDDTVAALGRLGAAHRRAQPSLTVVGVAGSNGKTTTKELVAALLAAGLGADHVLKTEGNLNNHLGVPLTLLRLTAEHRAAAIELGMSAPRELAYLCELAAPDIGVIVSIGIEHLEHLGSLEGIAAAEAEILPAVKTAVVPDDEPLLAPHVAAARARGTRVLTFGDAESADVRVLANRPGARGLTLALRLPDGARLDAEVPLLGAHNGYNAAAAVAAALAAGVPTSALASGLGAVRPAKHRAQLLTVAERTVIDDCYNASPPSMRSAILALVAATPPGARKIAVLGDMLELGPDSPALHAELGAYAARHVDHLIALGPGGAQIAAAARATLAARATHTDDPADAAAAALLVSRPGDVILIKASRGMRLERVLDALLKAGS